MRVFWLRLFSVCPLFLSARLLRLPISKLKWWTRNLRPWPALRCT